MLLHCSLLLLSVLPEIIAIPAGVTSITQDDFSNITIRDLPDPDASGSKRGIAGTSDSYHAFQTSGSHVSWAYDWSSGVTWQNVKNFDYVPMLWGARSSDTQDWVSKANYAISRGSRYLLSFNEPDVNGQSSLSPQDAVNAYRKYMNPFVGRAYLGAPAVTQSGQQWLEDFLRLCTGCHIDFVPVHFYDSYTNAPALKSFIGRVHAIAGSRKIWLTEFGPLRGVSVTDLDAFLGDVVPWLDSQSYIQRYAMNNELGGSNSLYAFGALTSPGHVYTYIAEQASAPDKMK